MERNFFFPASKKLLLLCDFVFSLQLKIYIHFESEPLPPQEQTVRIQATQESVL